MSFSKLKVAVVAATLAAFLAPSISIAPAHAQAAKPAVTKKADQKSVKKASVKKPVAKKAPAKKKTAKKKKAI